MQRYVANELIHFVGRGKPSEVERYELLKHILNTGQLIYPTYDPNNEKVTMRLNPNKPYKDRLDVDGISFCDIPINDLNIHMQKYGRFGISFRKRFLLEKGANPVFYYAVDKLECGAGLRFGKSGIFFTDIMAIGLEIFKHYRDDTTTFDAPEHDLQGTKIGKHTGMTFEQWYGNLISELFAFIKPFMGDLDEGDEEQFYMEREWKITYRVVFSMADVYRVILPQEYAEKFNTDFREKYLGQITFADDLGGGKSQR